MSSASIFIRQVKIEARIKILLTLIAMCLHSRAILTQELSIISKNYILMKKMIYEFKT